MNTLNSIFYASLILCSLIFASCKKDVDKKLVGTYKGTAKYKQGTASNPVRDKDTLYNDVIITITEGTESTRKETRLSLVFTPSSISAPYSENMTVNDGAIEFYRTNRGAAGSFYRWEGTINSTSLHLINRNEEGNGTIGQWEFKAQRQ